MNNEISTESIKLEGQLEYKDLLRIYRETNLKIGSGSWFVLIILCIMLINSIVFMFLPFERSQVTSSIGHEMHLMNFMPIIVLSLIIYCMIWPPAIKNQLRTSKIHSKSLLYQISSDGIKQVNDIFEGTYKWESIYKAHETKNDFLLYLSTSQCLFLPKRFFQSTADIAHMQTLIKSKVSKVSGIKS